MRWSLLAVFLTIGSPLFSQTLRISDVDRFSWITEEYMDCDDPGCSAVLGELKSQFMSRGYLLHEFHTHPKNDTISLRVQEGPQFKLGKLYYRNVPTSLITETFDSVFRHDNLENLYAQILSWYENNGHPFAQVRLDSISMSGRVISGRVNAIPGPRYSIVHVKERNNVLSERWLSKYLDLKSGDLYDQRKIESIREQLEQLGFELVEEPVVNFQENSASVVVQVKKKVQNSFDALIGLQQHPVTTKANLVGFADLEIGNLFRSSKSVGIHWERIRSSTQELDLDYQHPAIFGRTTLIYSFSLTRLDSSFLTTNNELLMDFRVTNGLTLTFGAQLRNANVIEYFETTDNVSADQSMRALVAGLAVKQRFISLDMRIDYGAKSIRGITTAEPSVFESEAGRLSQVTWTADLMADIPVAKKISLRERVRMGTTNSRQLFYNDLFQLGGNYVLRGFDERSILAKTYFALGSDLQFELQGASRWILFIDASRSVSTGQSTYQNHVGFGSGFTLDLNESSSLNLLLGWGTQGGAPVDFSRAKVHVGYVSKF